jgi:hypothetical protein
MAHHRPAGAAQQAAPKQIIYYADAYFIGYFLISEWAEKPGGGHGEAAAPVL